MIISGKVLSMGDNINTDEIIPGRYLSEVPILDLGKYAFASVQSDFHNKIKKYPIIAAGKNFGCGSSREQAVFALKYAGVKAIVARSFARIFFRNALNNALPVVEVQDFELNLSEGQYIKIYLEQGLIKTKDNIGLFRFKPIPRWMIEIIKKDGYIPWLREQIQ